MSPGQIYARLFCRAAGMSGLQSFGIVLLADKSLGAILTSTAIAWWWLGATRDGVDYRLRYSRLWYALGGGSGAALVLLVSRWF